MKKLFTAIRKNDFDSVKKILEQSPEAISSVSKGAPKKDEGQSPLQVALKASSSEIIHYLLDHGTDVNFMEGADSSNPWRTPVIHDAINRAVMCSRWNSNRPDGIEVFSTQEQADEAYEILKRMISLGTDVNAADSFGNACLGRACLQARQILPAPGSSDRILTDELKADISRIFSLLLENGADLDYISPNSFGKTVAEEYGSETVGMFLKYQKPQTPERR